ncbi:MAG TPA: type II toxin-antitoxin system ParD family antitoxin [Caulobacter sp.]|nr:type II toxin-antitoxin system ParD family antitoxin [Caulobacter sp.]
MSITLPVEMADSVRAKVARGDYASESEVIREGLRALEAQEEAVEQWLRTEVKTALEDMETHPERAIPAADVRASIERLHAERSKSR